MIRSTLRRVAVATLLFAVGAAAPAPVHADPTDWVHVGGGEVGRLPGVDPVVGLVSGIVSSASGTACSPKSRGLTIHDLRHDTWWNSATGEIAYWWRNAGSAEVSADCASSVRVDVQISDYAPYGQPPVVRGRVATTSTSTASGGMLSTTADADLWVIEYAPLRAYHRGSSLLEVKVTGSYYNTKARATLPLGCVVSYTSVTPTPAGPVVGPSTAAEPCAA